MFKTLQEACKSGYKITDLEFVSGEPDHALEFAGYWPPGNWELKQEDADNEVHDPRLGDADTPALQEEG